MRQITCYLCDNDYNTRTSIVWRHINEDGAIDDYCCEAHLSQDAVDDPDVDTTGWEEIEEDSN